MKAFRVDSENDCCDFILGETFAQAEYVFLTTYKKAKIHSIKLICENVLNVNLLKGE